MKKKENNRIEYKQELTSDVDIEKEVIAFLNTLEGGFIFIGIDKTGKPVGVPDIDGVSIPRNKELMRIYNDLELVEQLGTGVSRILEHYGKECFRFSENFTRIIFPAIEEAATTVTPPVTPPVEQLTSVMTGEHNRSDLQVKLGLSDKKYFIKSYLQPALEQGFIEMTIPDKPNSSKQKYRLTEKGKTIKT